VLQYFSGWFGIRKEFCPWILDACPILQEYGNISYKIKDNRNSSISVSPNNDSPPVEHDVRAGHKRTSGNARSNHHNSASCGDDQPKCVVPIVSIEMPD
jgi:hypothetical protein